MLDILQTPSPAQPKKSTPSKLKFSTLPSWLRMVLGLFAIYVIVVVVFQIQQLPSGSVQKTQLPEAATLTDPSVVDKISQLEKDVAADPKNADLLLQLANSQHDAKFYPRAIESYKKYVVLAPKDLDAHVDLGICYFEVGNIDQAIKEIEGVVKIDPKHQMAAFNLGIINLTDQNVAEAKKWFKKCVDIDPQSTAGLKAQEILKQH